MRCSFLVRAVVVASAILLSRSAAGHGFHAAFSIIDADPKTGALHVTHRMFTQDVDTLIKARSNAAVTVRSGAAFERAIESYIRATFSLRDETGAALPLIWSRASVADDLVIVSFEGPRGPKILAIDSQLLMETNADQVNTVNVTMGGDTQTAVFRDGDPPKQIRF